MLDLLAFDLDGTLADTETLKAESYAWAAHRLRPDVDPEAVEAAYTGSCIGRSRQEIAASLLHRFDLAEAARQHDDAGEPWESYVGLRLERYRAMLADVGLVRAHAHADAVAMAKEWAVFARSVALVTTSDARNAGLVLGALGLADVFGTVVTADDVENTKPDPESYRLALARTGSEAERSVAIEDSPAGVRGAVAAGLAVVAVPDRFTADGVQALVRDGLILDADVAPPDGLREAIARRSRQRGSS